MKKIALILTIIIIVLSIPSFASASEPQAVAGFISKDNTAEGDKGGSSSINNDNKESMPKIVVINASEDLISISFAESRRSHKLGIKTPAELPEIIKDQLVIPIEPLATIFNGAYSLDIANKKAKLTIDDTLFEFTLYQKDVLINGVPGEMEYEARLDQGIVRVPARVFVDRLNTYEVKILFNESVMLIKKKEESGDYTDPSIHLSNDKYRNIPAEVDAVADNIIAKISKPGMSEYDKVLAVNRYIVENTEYGDDIETVYDVLIRNTGTCGHYSLATGILLTKMGVEVYEISGYAGIDGLGDFDEYEYGKYSNHGHTWNIVKIGGQFYHLDTTWNDPTDEVQTTKYIYGYFLLSDNQIQFDHIWRKSSYPKCTNEYNAELIDKVSRQGYVPITGRIQMDGNKIAKEDIYLRFSAVNDQLLFHRILMIEKGKSEARFMLIPEKKCIMETAIVSFSMEDLLNHKTAEKYKLEVQKIGNSYNITVKSEDITEVKCKLVLPEPAKVKQRMIIRENTMTPRGNGHTIIGEDTAYADFIPGATEAEAVLKCVIPKGKHWYNLNFSGNNNNLYLNEKGELVTDFQRIDGIRHPLNDLIVKVPREFIVEPAKQINESFGLTDTQLGEIKTAFIEAHIGEHKKLAALKNTGDARLIEKTPPVEVDGIERIYYSEELSSGVQIFRSYSQEKGSKVLEYSITANRVEITEGNYLELYNTINEYLRELVGAEKLIPPTIYIGGEGVIANDSITNKDLYARMIKGYASMYSIYEKENVIYRLNMGGRASSETAVFGIGIKISHE